MFGWKPGKGIAAAKKAKAKSKSSTAKKGTKTPKRSTATSRVNKSRKTPAKKESKPMSVAESRRLHRPIPDTYNPKPKASQKIHAQPPYILKKNNMAPLGRPPGVSKVARGKYDKLRDELTPKGRTAKPRPVHSTSKSGSRAYDKDELAYRKALAAYQEEQYEVESKRVDMRQVVSDLEDWGYDDFNPNWRRLSAKNKRKAWHEMRKYHEGRY